jgi:iron complex outermembrane recepter protein
MPNFVKSADKSLKIRYFPLTKRYNGGTVKTTMRKYLLALTFSLLLPVIAAAQVTISGKVTDKADGAPLPGANVSLEGTTIGNSSALDGSYTIRNVRPGTYVVKATFIGFRELKKEITVGRNAVTVNFEMEEAFIESQGLEITADRARERETPVAFSDIPKVVLEQQLASRDIPLILNTTPGIYATASGGGSGDSRINMRGFDQRNISVMINGVPVNDMENGWVYWSNWDGLGDVTSNIQVQRGLGASNLASPSFGGTINILTDAAENERKATFRQEVGSDNFLKSTLALNTGLVNNKWAFSTSLVRKTGDGVAKYLYTDAYAYFATFAYNINSRNRVDFFLVGAPQAHGQRTSRANDYISNFDSTFARNLGIQTGNNHPVLFRTNETNNLSRGLEWNQHWSAIATGTRDPNAVLRTYYNGKSRNPRYTDALLELENYFHKPQANLNWYLRPNDKWFISNVFYASKGIGGGTGQAGTTQRPSFANPLNFQTVLDANATRINNTYSATEKQSNTILRNSVNQHNWFGWLGRAEFAASKNLNLSFGLDGRRYVGQHWREVRNLIGGDYYVDTTDRSIYTSADYTANRALGMRRLGDKIQYWNDGLVDWMGGFVQAEGKVGNMTAALSTSLAQTIYDRIDYFRPKVNGEYERAYIDKNNNATRDTDEVSEKQKFPGYSIKGGINYNLTSAFNVFVNGGVTKRAPVFDAIYRNNNTIITKADGTRLDLEGFKAFEIGAAVKNSYINSNLNAYYGYWENRTNRHIGAITTNTETGATGATGVYTIREVDQKHMGIELDTEYRLNNKFRFKNVISVGDWKMVGQAKVRGTNQDTNADLGEGVIDVDGIYVPDQPQKSVSFQVNFTPMRGAYVNLTGTHFRDMYSFFDINSKIIVNGQTPDKAQPWKVPNYNLFDLHMGYHLPFKIQGIQKIQFSASVLNLFDELYISDAVDGVMTTNSGFSNQPAPSATVLAGLKDQYDHTATLAKVFFGRQRNINFGVKITI